MPTRLIIVKCFECRRRVQMLYVTEDLCSDCYKKLKRTPTKKKEK